MGEHGHSPSIVTAARNAHGGNCFVSSAAPGIATADPPIRSAMTAAYNVRVHFPRDAIQLLALVRKFPASKLEVRHRMVWRCDVIKKSSTTIIKHNNINNIITTLEDTGRNKHHNNIGRDIELGKQNVHQKPFQYRGTISFVASLSDRLTVCRYFLLSLSNQPLARCDGWVTMSRHEDLQDHCFDVNYACG